MGEIWIIASFSTGHSRTRSQQAFSFLLQLLLLHIAGIESTLPSHFHQRLYCQCDPNAADGEGREGLELGNPSASNGVVAALIVSEQLQRVKHTYLTRCLLAGSSTLASIN